MQYPFTEIMKMAALAVARPAAPAVPAIERPSVMSQKFHQDRAALEKAMAEHQKQQASMKTIMQTPGDLNTRDRTGRIVLAEKIAHPYSAYMALLKA